MASTNSPHAPATPRGGRRDDPRNGLVRRLPEEGLASDRSANTTPGNKKGGLSNIVEKAMGSIVKSGSAPISGVLSPGEKLRSRRA